jgi:DNA-binding CsgD family transcriptional regulator
VFFALAKSSKKICEAMSGLSGALRDPWYDTQTGSTLMQLQSSLSHSTPMPHPLMSPAPRRRRETGSIALFMVGTDLSIRSANDAGRELMSSDIVKTRRFATCDGVVNSKLQRWLRERTVRNDADELRLRLDTDCGRTFAITAICAGQDSDEGDDETEIIILVQEPEATGRSKVAMVAAAHTLTPAETRLLELIYKGYDTPAAAEKLGVSKTTARTHLQRIFAKTDTARQSALVHFVANFVKP